MELPRLSSFHSLQNSGQTQNRPCPETAWHTGPLQVARSFWLTQSGLCTPKVIEMVWITESTTQRNQLTWWWTLQCWNLPCYAEIGWLVSFYQPEKLLQSTFSTQTTKNKTTKNILERNKIALMTSRDAALVCIQINTLPRVHRIKALNFATTFFHSGAWRTGLFKFGFWYKYPRKMGGEDTGEEISTRKYHKLKSRQWRRNWYCLVTCGYGFLWGLLSMDSYCAPFGVTWYFNLAQYFCMHTTSLNILVTSCSGYDHLQILNGDQ